MSTIIQRSKKSHMVQMRRIGIEEQRIGKGTAYRIARTLTIATVILFGGMAPGVILAEDDPVLGPRVRNDGHGAGSCVHNHLKADDGTLLESSKCEAGAGGVLPACLIIVDGKRMRGMCDEKTNGKPSPNCVCDTTKKKAQRAGISAMSNTVKTIIQASQIGDTTLGCGQLLPLLTVLASNQNEVLALGTVDENDVKVLGQVDYMLAAWNQMTSFAAACAVTFPFTPLRAGMLDIKGGIIQALSSIP